MFCCHFCLYLSKALRNVDHRCVRFCWSLLWMSCPPRFPDLFYSLPDELFQPYTKWSNSGLHIVTDQCFLTVLVLKRTGLHKTSETLMTDNVCWLSALPVLRGTKLTPWEADFFLFVTQSYVLKRAWSRALVSFLCWVSCTGIGEVTYRTGSYLTGVGVLNNFC